MNSKLRIPLCWKEFSELFESDDPKDSYLYACVSRGLNPYTQEPWTDEEVAEQVESLGFDPRNVADWFDDEEKSRALVKQYFNQEQEGE